jgi:hypothetical protein
MLKIPGGRVIHSREEKVSYRLFSILTPRCPKHRFYFEKL